MAAGEPFFNCDNNHLTLMQTFRKMIYDDGQGKPVLILSGSTTLQNWFDCREERKGVTTQQILKKLIVKDAEGNPAFNTQ